MTLPADAVWTGKGSFRAEEKEFVFILLRLKTIYLTFSSVSQFRLVSDGQFWFQVIVTAILHESTLSYWVCSGLAPGDF